MTFAILSDIHSNLEALEAVLEDIEKQNIKEIVFLGDIIGYGANPLEVLEISKGFSVNILGNHDQALFDPSFRSFFNPAATEALDWTQQVINRAGKEASIEAMQKYSLHLQRNNMLFSHGDYQKNQNYIECQEHAVETFSYMAANGIDVCFVGHSHLQGFFIESGMGIIKVDHIPLERFKKERLIINPGSVGQPRDGNPKAAYAICTAEEVLLKRIAYDIKGAARKILNEKGLPDSLAFRLYEGH